MGFSTSIELFINSDVVGAGSTYRTSGTSTTTGPNPSPLRWDWQTVQFSINAWVGFLIIAPMNSFLSCSYDVPKPAYEQSESDDHVKMN